jgi:hypothetical protein
VTPDFISRFERLTMLKPPAMPGDTYGIMKVVLIGIIHLTGAQNQRSVVIEDNAHVTEKPRYTP